MPCTLGMIKRLDLDSETIKIYNTNVETVEIYARTISEKPTALRLELELQDLNTTFTVCIFKKQAENPSKLLKTYSYIENGYVRIIANLRKGPDQFTLVISLIENVESRTQINEFYSRLLLTKLKLSLQKPHDYFAAFE